jgi:hypothetical protein
LRRFERVIKALSRETEENFSNESENKNCIWDIGEQNPVVFVVCRDTRFRTCSCEPISLQWGNALRSIQHRFATLKRARERLSSRLLVDIPVRMASHLILRPKQRTILSESYSSDHFQACDHTIRDQSIRPSPTPRLSAKDVDFGSTEHNYLVII